MPYDTTLHSERDRGQLTIGWRNWPALRGVIIIPLGKAMLARWMAAHIPLLRRASLQSGAEVHHQMCCVTASEKLADERGLATAAHEGYERDCYCDDGSSGPQDVRSSPLGRPFPGQAC